MGKYLKYASLLDKVGEIPLNKRISFDDLNPSKEETQMLYRDIRDDSFDGTLCYYLYWIIAKHYLYIWVIANKSMKTEISTDVFDGISPRDLKCIIRAFIENPAKFYLDKDFQIIFDADQVFRVLTKKWNEIIKKEVGLK
jgi:hypothetical protein